MRSTATCWPCLLAMLLLRSTGSQRSARLTSRGGPGPGSQSRLKPLAAGPDRRKGDDAQAL